MKILTTGILVIPLLLSIILDSYGLKPPICHPTKTIWKETQDPAVCTDDNNPTMKPIILRNGVNVSAKSTKVNGKNQVSYQPLRADEGQVLMCYVSDQTCTFGTLNVVYKPKVTLIRTSKNEFLCTVDASPFKRIGWSIIPNYLINYTEKKQIRSNTNNSMLIITKPSEMMDNTNITCSSRNDIGSDSVTIPYMENLPSTESDIDDNTSYRTSTSNSLPSTETLTENHGHTTTPWKVGKSGNISRKSIPVYVIVVIVGGFMCLLILIMFCFYIYKRPYRDDNLDNKNTADNSNNDPIYVELNHLSGQSDNALDIYHSEVAPSNYYEHLPDVVSNKMETGHNSDSLKKQTFAKDSEFENHVEGSVQEQDNLPKKCPEDAPAYFVLEENEDGACTIYEDINDKYQQIENSSADYDHGGQEQSFIPETLNDYNIYAEIGTGDTTKDFDSHENEIYESLDRYDKFQIRPLPEFSKSVLPTNRADSKTCQIASAPEQRTYTDECNIKFLLK